MIKMHQAATGAREGEWVPCPAEHQCRLASDSEHKYFENKEEADEYNQLTIAREHAVNYADFSEKDRRRFDEINRKSRERFEEKFEKELVEEGHEGTLPLPSMFGGDTAFKEAMDNAEEEFQKTVGAIKRGEIKGLLEVDSERVRAELAKAGYHLDVLVNDPDPMVRYEVALQGAHLDKLSQDKDPFIRMAVADRFEGVGSPLWSDDGDSYEIGSGGYHKDKIHYDYEGWMRRHGSSDYKVESTSREERSLPTLKEIETGDNSVTTYPIEQGKEQAGSRQIDPTLTHRGEGHPTAKPPVRENSSEQGENNVYSGEFPITPSANIGPSMVSNVRRYFSSFLNSLLQLFSRG